MLFLLVGCVGNWYTQSIPVNPFTWRQADENEKPENVIRILEYNICHKDEYLQPNLANYQALADYLLSKDADIMILPEHFGPYAPQLDSILHAHYPHSFATVLQYGYNEEAVFSRYPITGCRNFRMNPEELIERHSEVDPAFVEYSQGGTMIYQVDLEMEGKPVTMVYVHLRSNNFDHAKEIADRKRDKLRNVFRYLRSNYAYRAAEAETICDSLQTCQNPILICGDFNDVSGSYVLNLMQDRLALKDAWWQRGMGPGFTFNDQHLLLRLDHLLYSSHFSLQGVSALSSADFSDHEPLLFDLKLRP